MTSQIGVTGLAVMGANLARNLARHGHQVVLHNRTQARTDALMAAHGGEGDFVPTTSTEEFVQALQRPRSILIMVQAGPATDAVIDELVPLLEDGDIVIDGGNARYQDTQRRTAALAGRGLHFVGAGVSGGEEGALNGPSIMPGGSDESYAIIGPGLESIAAVVDGTPCCTHVGTDGAGHFVKMVHNGIEYADMQLIAEAYDLLRHRLGLSPKEIGDGFASWNEGDLDSYLIEITAEVLRHADAAPGNPVRSPASRSSTSSWTRRSRRAPAAGPCSRRWTSASRSAASPRPSSPGPCPGTPTSGPPRRRCCRGLRSSSTRSRTATPTSRRSARRCTRR